MPDPTLTVCSAGTWRRRWPWRCCQRERCDLWSHCFRGTVRRERSLSTEGLEPLYSEAHGRWGQCDESPHAQSNLLRRDLPACWKMTVSVYTWTCDPRGKPPNLDTRCCSRTCSLSGQTAQPWWLVPVKADGHQPHVKERKMALSPLSFVWDPWKWRKWLCPLPSPGPPPWRARCHGDTPPSLLKWRLHHTTRDDATTTSLL